MRFFRALLILPLLLGGALGWNAVPQSAAARAASHKHSPAVHTRANVLLITLDTTRADRMGFLGSTRGLTPNLDALARQSIVFSRAYAHVPLTTASHTTILTGTYPQFNHVNDFGVPLSPRLPYLPEILHRHGYHTAAFVGSLVLDPLEGTAPGFDRGFDIYNAGFRLRPRGADRYQTVERRGGEVVSRALGWLRQRPPGPFFLWVHLYDAHDPYDPPPPFKEKYASQPYDGEIAYLDSVVGTLLDHLRSAGMFSNTIIAIMADHGESLGEHGENTHGVFLYDETIHVPLLIKLPGAAGAEKRVDTRAGLVDVAPTVLTQLGIQVPSEMQGEPLQNLLSDKAPKPGGTPPDRAAYSETDYPHRAFGWSSLRALRSGKYLYIRAPQPELYNQDTDPGAQKNLAGASSAVASTIASQLDQFRAKTGQSIIDLAKPSADEVAKLQALGYVASSSSDEPGKTKDAGIDPKSRIEVSNFLHDAMLDVEDGRYQQAVPLLQRVLKDQPEMPIAEMQLGIAQSRLNNFHEALEPLQKAVKLVPDSGMGHYELGLALFETGDWNAAAPQFEAAVARAPRWTDAHFSLAAVYARIDRVPDAMKELDIALELNPDHYRANLLRGRILSLQQNPMEALPNLEKAVQVQPKSVEAHAFLAQAYEQLGRQRDATREQHEADRLKTANP